jgi:hypothetical protein
MTYKMYVAFIASLSVALTVVSNQSFGRSGAAHSGKSASTHSAFHPSAVRPKSHTNAKSLRRHHERNPGWAIWPTAGGFYGFDQSLQPSNVERDVDATRSVSEHITYTYDVPWDAAHRYLPAEKVNQPIVRVYEYVPGCRSQTETVPRGDGTEQTVNMVRC